MQQNSATSALFATVCDWFSRSVRCSDGQLLPLTASLHAAGGSGTFAILRFSQEPAPALVLADGPGGGTLLDNQPSVAAYEQALAELRSLALTEQESASWLMRMAGGPTGSARVSPLTARRA